MALTAMVVVVALLGGGAAAWAATNGGPSGYVMAHVVNASVSQSLTVVGTVAPVSDASVAFQVGGKVATVSATAGQQVSPGQTLATLDTTALSETVSSDQSTLAAAQAKLSEDEANQTSSASHPATPSTTTTTKPTSTTPTTAPVATITADQNILTADEAITSVDQQQEAADLAQAESTCGTGPGGGSTPTSTTTPSNASTCTNDLLQVAADEKKVSTDQSTVATDEATLADALGEGSSTTGTGTGSPTGTGSGSPTSTGGKGTGSHDLAAATSPTASATVSAAAPTSNSSTPSGSGGNGSSTPSDTPEQIAADQADIDSAQADLINAQQSLNAAALTSPISGTIVSVGVTAGDTVSAGSSTEVIVIIGTQSYEVSATLTSAQVAQVKVNDTAQVAVDDITDPSKGTVSQVGPVQSGDSGYSYPVVVALPTSVQGLFAGSSANVTIATGGVANVLAVPTSAVQTAGSVSYVETLKDGSLARKVIKVGMVGSIYTQVHSGLSLGQAVVLADLSQPVPSSNANTTLGGGLGGGLGGLGGGAGRFRQFVTPSGGGGGATTFNVGG